MIEEYKSLIERIAWYSVGIVNLLAQVIHAEKRMADDLGSGTLCTWNGHHLILTAKHLVKRTPPDKLAFLLRVDDALNWEGSPQKEEVIQRVPLPVERIVCCKEHDLAAVILRSRELAGRRMQFCELPKQLRTRRTLRRKGSLVLLGFPWDRVFTMAEVKSAEALANYTAARPTILHATIAKPPKNLLGSQYDPERDVLLDYKPDPPDMKPYGFSGAAVWSQRLGRPGSLWSPVPMIFGVQSSAFMKSQLLQVIGAATVREFLEQSLPVHGR